MNCNLYVKALKRRVSELGITKAVIGLSGGKDSNIVAKLMVDVLGPDNVIGVMIPNGDANDALAVELARLLNINVLSCNIGDAFVSLSSELSSALSCPEIGNGRYAAKQLSRDATINMAPRLRMTVLYAVAQSIGTGARVIGTTNRSENYIGWFTKWGDGAADFEPIINLTVRDLHELGIYIGLQEKFVKRVPVDGLAPGTDEERFGFTYEQLDDYIHSADRGEAPKNGDPLAVKRIGDMHRQSMHKRVSVPAVDF